MAALGDCDYVFHIDSDEVLEEATLFDLCTFAEGKQPRVVLAPMLTYWKDTRHVVEYGDDTEAPLAMVLARSDVRFTYLRVTEPGTVTVVNHVLHHLSFVRTDAEVLEKIRLFGHADEIVVDWFQRVWKAWDQNNDLTDLHPYDPTCYHRAVPCPATGVEEVLTEFGV
jgi:glycosyltransferase involved in cell wall biosynthesis